MTAAVGGELGPGNRMQALHDKGRNAVEENFVTIPCNHSKMIYGQRLMHRLPWLTLNL